MSVQPQVVKVATNWPGNFVVDDLLVPLFGSADVPIDQCSGTLASKLLAATFAGSVLTLLFPIPYIQPGIAVVPTLEVGTASLVDVAVDAISFPAQTIGIRFRTPAGGATGPPIVSSNAKVHLAIFRPLAIR